jgi:hypothetical protein
VLSINLEKLFFTFVNTVEHTTINVIFHTSWVRSSLGKLFKILFGTLVKLYLSPLTIFKLWFTILYDDLPFYVIGIIQDDVFVPAFADGTKSELESNIH